MTLVFISQSDDPALWTRMLQAAIPELEVRVWPEVGEAADVDVALVWKPPRGALREFPNLRLIASLGMGVDHIFADPELPAGVPVARLVDEDITVQMAEYVALGALYFLRRLDEYEDLQRQRSWRRLAPTTASACPVGILGLGVIGTRAAALLRAIGFPVAGWSRTEKRLEGVACFHGEDGLDPFLARSNLLVCLLPLTPGTEGLIDAGLLARLPRGACLINCARGGHVVEADLLAALHSGQLHGALLDVFRDEPLPADHPFWTHPRVRLTPHIAGVTRPEAAAAQVVENIRRVRAGEPVLNRVDPARGY